MNLHHLVGRGFKNLWLCFKTSTLMLQTASICVLSHVKYHIISSEDYEHVKLEKSIPLNFYNTGSELTL